MQNAGGGDISRDEYLFHHLVVMFQTLALQQLGKLISPITGKMERDLQQARITIDMLQMVKEKTAGNLSGRERGVLDGVLTELQLNYIDEMKREGEGPKAETEAGKDVETSEQAAKDTGQETAEPVGKESGSKKAAAGSSSSKKKTKKRTVKKKKSKPDLDSRT